jgi:hypothetical protein
VRTLLTHVGLVAGEVAHALGEGDAAVVVAVDGGTEEGEVVVDKGLGVLPAGAKVDELDLRAGSAADALNGG